jgi:hypothetical protein
MAKNLIPEVAKMLGVELGEEFKVKGYDELVYRLTNDGLKLTHDSGIELADVSAKVAFAALLNGKDEIVKLPWKPKKGEKYWGFWYSSVNDAWLVLLYTWANNPADLALYKVGWVYRTEKEAKAALPAVAKELGVEYKL